VAISSRWAFESGQYIFSHKGIRGGEGLENRFESVFTPLPAVFGRDLLRQEAGLRAPTKLRSCEEIRFLAKTPRRQECKVKVLCCLSVIGVSARK
jgi:hypothetical protein